MATKCPKSDYFSPEYNQMDDDYNDPELNSYNSGPGALMQQNMSKEGENTKLYVTNIPAGLTEDGLRNIFSIEGDIPENVYIHKKSNQHSNKHWAFVTFKSLAAAHSAMVAIHKRPPYNFYVHFARVDDEKTDNIKGRHSMSGNQTSDESSSSFTLGSRGRGKLPPMRGLPPSAFKALRSVEEPYINDLGEDYSPGRFLHCDTSFEHCTSNAVFSPFAEGEYDDGRRKMNMGRGFYIVPQETQTVEIVKQQLFTIEERVAAYLGYKSKDFLFDDDAIITSETKLSLPIKPGNCTYCTRPSIYICSNCKSWYCTNYCRKKHWNAHKNACVPRILKFENGYPTYKLIIEEYNNQRDTGKVYTENKTINGHDDFKNSAINIGNIFDNSTLGDQSDNSSCKLRSSCSCIDIVDSSCRHNNTKHMGKHRNQKSLRRCYRRIENDVVIKAPASLIYGKDFQKENEVSDLYNFTHSPIPVGIYTKVTVGAMGKDGEFFAYRVDDYNSLGDMMASLNEYCHQQCSPIISIDYGTKCIVPFEGDWYRAEIIHVFSDKVKVKFIDFGKETIVPNKDLKMMPPGLSEEPPMAHRFILASSPDNPKLEEDLTLAVKPISKDSHGRWLVEAEGVNYSQVWEKLEDGTSICVDNGKNLKTNKHLKHFLSLLQNGDFAVLQIEQIRNDEFLTGSIKDNGEFPIHQEISSIISEESISNDNMKLVPGMNVAAKWKNNWYRGYLMRIRNETPIVALIDKGKVVIPQDVAELPKKVINVPECGVKVIFDKPVLKKELVGESVIVKNIQHDYKNNHVHGEIDEFGSVVILPWVPTIEEAGLDSIIISSGSKVKISSYHSPSAIYIQSCSPEHKTMLSELIQDVASLAPDQALKRKPLVGEFLICRFIEDRYYYRAQVFQRCGEKYKVNFVDFGNTEIVSLEDMKQLPDHLKKVPCCAVKVGLKDVPNVPFNTQCMKFLNELAANNMEMFLTYKKDLSEVTLELNEGDIINKILFSFLEPSWKKPDFSPFRAHVFMGNEIKYEAWKKGSKFMIAIASVIRYDKILALRPASGLLNYVERTLTPMITEYCESTPNESYNPRTFEVCLAKFHEDGKWYRALSIKSYQHNASEVFYLDYGNSGEVLHRCIRKMVPEFMEAPAVLKFCEVYGLPKNLNDSQAAKLKNYSTELRTEAEVIEEEAGEGNCILRIPEIENYILSQFNISMKFQN